MGLYSVSSADIYIYIYISWDLSHVEIKIALFYKYVQQGANNLLVLRSQWYAQYICNTFPDSKQDNESKNIKENIDNDIFIKCSYTLRGHNEILHWI